MGFTAVALVETGGLALAPDDLVVHAARNEKGKWFSRFGIGSSLVQVPAAVLAFPVEDRFGLGASNSLFLAAPILLVLAAGFAAARVAGLLGGAGAAPLALLLCVVASPLGSYASTLLSEPAQAACLAGVLSLSVASSLEKSERRASLLAALAGAAIGGALLAKSVAGVLSLPLALPLLAPGPVRLVWRRVAAAAAGAVPLAGIWLAFEVLRFGRVGGGYGDEGFTHPLGDGLLRLTLMPNRGLLFFFPAAAVAAAFLARCLLTRDGEPVRRLAALGTSLSLAGLLISSAMWWGWHGLVGWGPRLLVPAVPLLAPFAALWLAGRRRAWSWAVVGAGVVLNLPPLLAHPSLVVPFMGSCSKGELSAEQAGHFPPSVVGRLSGGGFSVDPNHVLVNVLSAAPHVVYPWFAWASLAPTPEQTAARLLEPPWLGDKPRIVPGRLADPDRDVPFVAPGFRWGWGRSLVPGGQARETSQVYVDALTNQIRRLFDEPPGPALLEVSRKLHRLSPNRDAEAYRLEALRLTGRRQAAQELAASLSPSARQWPLTAAAIALHERDGGRPELARSSMQIAAGGSPFGRYSLFARTAVESWPSDLWTLSGHRRSDAPSGPAERK
jgi:hypothetical protein